MKKKGIPLPCKDCLTLTMCRDRFLKKYSDAKSALSNLYILIDMCERLDDYLFESSESSIRADRIFETRDFLKGN